ncbi:MULTISPECIES: DapH/DapD/GlmU-related protein [Serratia]|uniref:DapH/DapD/GlmU-related protein n=1 Tax=Serratia TaxID=613 RepID=UPI00094AD74F|nr:DapH/DapD/GlmU-related protein [Serratia marcescens]
MLNYITILFKRKINPEHARLIFNTSHLSKKRRNKALSKSGILLSKQTQITPPFYYEYGNINLIGDVFVNANCTFLDDEKIIINDGSMIGPNVTLSTVSHHVTPENRHDKNITAPITIGENVWICAGAVILPGVTIGDNSVIGANSVVNCNVPENTLYAGTPAVFKKNL